ncbi:MAG: insulinase family protein [Defluviitaleaceae bacterium]|nr:insulinase family protein [Defluviitaleaceae bacterium]
MIHGYTLVEQRPLPHMNGEGFLYEHVSGAQVMHIKNADTNKVFSLTFKTPPADDTGIAHIMEHAVLNGSRKYPLKDPFMQLANGSLYTFLNAFTYPDKTMYPVASTNNTDFMNLMDVYLDAVFFPMIYERQTTLAQEGWHYQLEDGELSYNGIVYNEMKGALSDPYRLLNNVVGRAMHPKSCLYFESGGNPDAIPNITNEDFLAFHKKYYRPENALIYFYGDMDIDICLAKMGEEYLSKFKKTGEVIEITPEPPFGAPVYTTGEYSVTEGDDLDDNYMIASYLLPHNMPANDVSALKVLNYILLATPASPLYKAMAEGEVGEDISGSLYKDVIHPYWSLTLKNATLTCEELDKFITSFLEKLCRDGLAQDFVTACLNYLEFQAKEEDFGSNTPKGLVYNIRSMSGWLYGACPWQPLMGINHLEEIRNASKDAGYFSGLIRKYLLDNRHKGFVMLSPVLDLDEKKDEEERKKLVAINAGLTDVDRAEIQRKAEALKAFQETPDPPEVLALIPRLGVVDIKAQIERTPLEVRCENGANVLYSPLETSGIIYTAMMFDMCAVPVDLLPFANILQYMLSKVATKKYDTTTLTQEIKGNLGGLGFSMDIINHQKGGFTPMAVVSAKFLAQNTGKMFEIVEEVLHSSLFSDKSQMRTYLLEMRASMEDWVLTSGSSLAISRSMTYFAAAAAYNDATSGLGYYNVLKNLCDNFEGEFEALQNTLVRTAGLIYNRNHAQYSVVCNEGLYAQYAAELGGFHNLLDDRYLPKANRPALIAPKNEGLITASKVQYNALSANVSADGHGYHGGMKVLANVLDNYLYEEIRVKGGAYGCGSGFNTRGIMFMYSYRDPQMEATYEIFKNAENHIRNLDLSRGEMEKFIIGTIRAFDKPATNASKGLTAAVNHIQGWTVEDKQKERDEVLATDITKIKSFAGLLADALAQDNICAVGNATVLEGKAIFGNVRKV